MDDKNRAEDALAMLNGIIQKLKDAGEEGVLLTMEEAALMVGWLKEANLIS